MRNSWRRIFRRRNLTQAFKITLAFGVILQVATVGAVIGIDEWRKRRNPPSATFPKIPPQKFKAKKNSLTLYTYGQDLYDDMLADIRNAKEYVFFETFIIKDDATGRLFRRALIEAAQRGVEVFAVIDTMGTLNQPPKVRKYPRIPHLHVKAFPLLRAGIITANVRRTGRDHRKLLVVDGKIGYVGGYNIGSLYATKWRDTHIRIAGPDVWELDNSFTDFWNEIGGYPALPDLGYSPWETSLRVVQNRPSKLSFPLRTMYLEAFDRARQRIWLTTAYFVPDREIAEYLIRAARRSVDVRIIIPEYSNHIVVDWVASVWHERLLRAGVRIFLFQNAMVHAKTMLVDEHWATVGTANLDRMSLLGNFEVNVASREPEIADALAKVFLNDLTNCKELTLKDWRKRNLLVRAGGKILGPIGPLV